MRLVCHEVQQAMAPFQDMLVLRLDSTACSETAAAKAMAVFHRSRQAAKQFRVRVPDEHDDDYCASISTLLSTYIAHSLSAGSALHAVKQCHVSIAVACPQQLAPLLTLLQALSALECSAGAVPVQLM